MADVKPLILQNGGFKQIGDADRLRIVGSIAGHTIANTYASRSAFVSDEGNYTWQAGDIVFAEGFGYEYDGTTTAISDLSGWKPYGTITPNHFKSNATPGTTGMGAAVTAAKDYAVANSGGSFSGDGGRGVMFVDQAYLIDSQVHVDNDEDHVKFFSLGGSLLISSVSGAAFRVGDATLFGGGDTTGTLSVYGVEFIGLRFKANDATAVDTIAIQSGKAPDLKITGCDFIDFWVSLDWHRQNTPYVTSCRFGVPGRTNTNPAEALLRLQGVYDSTNSYTPGGGAHIFNNEFLGRSSDTGALECCILIKSVDGFYFGQNHFNNYSEAAIKVAPDDTQQNNIITDIISSGGNYFDAAAGASSTNVKLTGTVSYGGASGNGLYQKILLCNDHMRGGGTVQYGVTVSVQDGGSFESTRGGIKNVSITNCLIGQHTVTGVVLNGTGSTRIPCTNPLVLGNVFYEGRKGGTASGTSYIDIDAKGMTVCNNTCGAEDNAPSQTIIADTSNYTNIAVDVAHNMLRDSAATVSVISVSSGAATDEQIGPNMLPTGPLAESLVVDDLSGAAIQSNATDTTAGRIPKMGNNGDFAALTATSLDVSSANNSKATLEATGDNTAARAVNVEFGFSDGAGGGIQAARPSGGTVADVFLAIRRGGNTNPDEIARFDSGDNLLVAKTAQNTAAAGIQLDADGRIAATRDGNYPLLVNRLTDDGTLVTLQQESTTEGSISVSGTTVSYNGGHLSRWSQADGVILRGTVMSNRDEMCVWRGIKYMVPVADYQDVEHRVEYFGNEPDGTEIAVEHGGETYTGTVYTEDNEQLNRMVVSDVPGDRNVAGVFQQWDQSDTYGDMVCAMTGDFVVRVGAGVTVARGDLLESAGDGTARPQADDVIRSCTVAKVTSTHVTETYDDGSYLVPCVLKA